MYLVFELTILKIQLKAIQLNIGQKGFANHCILLSFTFYTKSQLHWNWDF